MPRLLKPTEHLLWNFIREFADPKVAQLGRNGKPAFRDYQFQSAHAIFESLLLQLMHTLTLRWARQMGKTETVGIPSAAAATMINLLMLAEKPPMPGIPYGMQLAQDFPDGLQIGIFGPREDTARVDYSRIRKILRRVVRKYQVIGWRFEVDNELKQVAVGPGPDGKERQLWYIEVLSAAPASEIESRSFNEIILEECQDIEEGKIVDDILPMGAASRATVLPVGTIGDKKSWYDATILYNQANCPERHLEFDYTVGIAQDFRDGAYADHIEREIAKTGENSESFRKMYKLQRVFEKDMLMSEETFRGICDIHEHRWEREPAELPPNVVLVAGLDIARDYDHTILKIGTADWRNVRKIGEQEVTIPRMVVRWKKTYGQKPHDEQFAEIHADILALFPGLKKFGAVAFDATGDRGDYSTKLESAGFFTIPVVFTGGIKPTEFDDRGQIVPGSKSHMCIQYVDAINTRQFSIAADEKYMGTVDYHRRLRQPKAPDAPILPPHPEYAKHRAELTTCERVWAGHGRLDLRAPKKSQAHDDEIDSDMLFCLAGIYFQPVDLSKVKSIGDRRTFTPSGDPLASIWSSLSRHF